MEQYMLTEDGKNATRAEKQAHRAFLKEHFNVLPQDILDVYVKASRERMAYQGFIGEAIIDTLTDNNQQAFRQLDKVCSKTSLSVLLTCRNSLLPYCVCSMLMDGAAIKRSRIG